MNSAYAHDDRIAFTCNFRDCAETVTLDEIEYVFCSDVNNCPHQLRANFGAEFLLLSGEMEVTKVTGTFFVICNMGPECKPSVAFAVIARSSDTPPGIFRSAF